MVNAAVKWAACAIVLIMLMPALSMASPAESGMTDSAPEPGITGLTPPVGKASAPLRDEPRWSPGGHVYIIVQSSLYSTIPDSIDLLEYDIENHRNAPFTADILATDWTDIDQVRDVLWDGYFTANESIIGAILVGDIPAAWYHMLNPPDWGANYWETFPIDLFYTDLDGDWGDGTGTESDPFNSHTAGSGDIEPEIWVGRIYADTLSGLGSSEIIIEDYIDRVDAYSLGLTTRRNSAYNFVDDDWYDWADEWGADLGLVYPDVTVVKEYIDTVKTTYMNALPQDHEWLSLFAHTGITYHQLIVPTGYSNIYNSEIEAANCQALFYNLFCCGAADYATDGYIQGYYAFANSGLLAIGSAKTGSMLEFQHFYQPLSEGACIGEAFRDWMEINLDIWGDESKAWFYGMNIAGDPTLETGGYDLPPEPPTALTVEHWGPEYNYDSTSETRYLRGVAGEASANGLSAYYLDTTNSATQGNWAPGNNVPVHLGMRVWKRSSAGTETEITSGWPVATVSRTVSGSGFQTAAWTPPETALALTDSIVVRVYGDTAYPPSTLRATFTTLQLGADRLEPVQWTVQYWTRMGSIAQGGSDWFWGTLVNDNHISGFTHSLVLSPRDPLMDNTLNWTASPSADLDHYNVYRSDSETGTYSLIGTAQAGADSFLDTERGTADATLWWYMVRAVDAAAQEEQNSNAVQEPFGIYPYSIDVTGIPAGQWAFVSYPLEMAAGPESVLDDMAWGDGGTDWDVAKAWDNAQKRWLTYRKGGTMNSFTQADSTMGFWLHLTQNGGDQHITVVGTAPGTHNINLYSGWNMVGYPSMTPRPGSETLPAQADMVSVWQAASPYIMDSTPGAVTMSHGNAYWVHVTADCTWTVNP